MSQILELFPFCGIDSACLGHYLMGLGLLRAASTRWSETRACWHDGLFYLAGTFTEREVTRFLHAEWQPTPYEQWWLGQQKADTKAKSSMRLWLERSTRPLAQVRVADTTIVPTGRNQFNPLFGKGGSVGRRNMGVAWRDALDLRRKPNSFQWLEASLFGKQTTEVPSFTNAGTWFVYDNKTFNSGLDWYREGSLSPWSFLLAMEGALLLRGGSGRRLGSRARPYAIFPFICQSLSPATNQDVGQKMEGEFWAPLWEQPATLGEVRILFQRGLARLGGRAATMPHEFAVAAMAAGADAGITHFVRFELRQTTSSQAYEALPRKTFAVSPRADNRDSHSSSLLEAFLGNRWFDTLPYEPARPDSKTRFSGLRGPLERLILEVASDPASPESWRRLWLQLAVTQTRIDRNSELRRRCRALPWLRRGWLGKAFPGTPPLEIRLAASIAGLGAGTDYPAQCNVFGVEPQRSRLVFHKSGRPARTVWHDGDAQTALLDFVQRRLTDCKSSDSALEPLSSGLQLKPSDISQFLAADSTLVQMMQLWLPALTLLDWTVNLPFVEGTGALQAAEPELLLWALFKPFFLAEKFNVRGRSFFRETVSARPSFARQLFNCLRRDAWSEAISLAESGYRAQGFRIVTPPVPCNFAAARVAAALAFPISTRDLATLVVRWLEPLNQSRIEDRQ
jgi:CRISPR-associated protein Csx17